MWHYLNPLPVAVGLNLPPARLSSVGALRSRKAVLQICGCTAAHQVLYYSAAAEGRYGTSRGTSTKVPGRNRKLPRRSLAQDLNLLSLVLLIAEDRIAGIVPYQPARPARCRQS